ncbi:PepSY domain-containing protein [Psychrobacillus sp. NPDC093180]|uniref:PepSY domain-containing protein n=1 Tax=Psychrobacillus sp. NPDC093180 TaxID=3364489 RepID=UPI0038028476
MAFGDKKDKEILFKMIVCFMIGIGSSTLLYEFVKPSYTYAEAKAIVEQKYDAEVIDSHFTTITQVESGKEVYRMNAIKDSKEIEIVFNPYTEEIIFLQ